MKTILDYLSAFFGVSLWGAKWADKQLGVDTPTRPTPANTKRQWGYLPGNR